MPRSPRSPRSRERDLALGDLAINGDDGSGGETNIYNRYTLWLLCHTSSLNGLFSIAMQNNQRVTDRTDTNQPQVMPKVWGYDMCVNVGDMRNRNLGSSASGILNNWISQT